MFAWINRLLEWFKSLFWKEEMELTLVGLQVCLYKSPLYRARQFILAQVSNKKSPKYGLYILACWKNYFRQCDCFRLIQ